MAKRKFDPVHPGMVLAEDFLKGMEISLEHFEKHRENFHFACRP